MSHRSIAVLYSFKSQLIFPFVAVGVDFGDVFMIDYNPQMISFDGNLDYKSQHETYIDTNVINLVIFRIRNPQGLHK